MCGRSTRHGTVFCGSARSFPRQVRTMQTAKIAYKLPAEKKRKEKRTEPSALKIKDTASVLFAGSTETTGPSKVNKLTVRRAACQTRKRKGKKYVRARMYRGPLSFLQMSKESRAVYLSVYTFAAKLLSRRDVSPPLPDPSRNWIKLCAGFSDSSEIIKNMRRVYLRKIFL